MKKRTLALILAALMILTSFVAVPASAETSGDWEYAFHYDYDGGTTVSIKKYLGTDTDVTIPSEIDGYKVSKVGFDDDCNYTTTCIFDSNSVKVKSVTIPDGVEEIDSGAFYSCYSLESVTIPDSVTTISKGAFYRCSSLKSVTIPDSVMWLGSFPFADCDSMTDINVGENNPAYKSVDGVLYTKDGKTLVTCPGGKTEVTIPVGVEEFCDYAFAGCTLLESINVEADNTVYKSIDGVLYTKDGKTLVACPGGKTEVTIPEGVTMIGEGAFMYCKSLTSITLPDSVTTIEKDAFNYNSYYNDYANWENGVLYIGHHLIDAEYDISGDYSIKEGTLTIADYAFSHCTSLTRVNIPDGVTTIGVRAFEYCTSLESVTIPGSVTEIGENAFWECESLTSVTIPEGVTMIGEGAFMYCKSLTSVTIPGSVTEIDRSTFYSCTSLESVTIPDSVTSIGDDAFYSCTSLTSVTIGDGVTTIGEGAFVYCRSLTSVTIGNNVTTIGVGAFSGCASLETVYYGGSEEQWNAIGIEDGNDPLLKANIVFAKEDPEVAPGDLNGDGKLNSRDVVALMKFLLQPNAELAAACDVNADGKLNSRDVIALMRLVLAQA